MGTINYSYINAAHIYAIEGEEFMENEFYSEYDYIDNNFPFNEGWEEGTHNEISYTFRRDYAKTIAEKVTFFGKGELPIIVQIYAVPGYYEGVSLDFDIMIEDPMIYRHLSDYERKNAISNLVEDVIEDGDLEGEEKEALTAELNKIVKDTNIMLANLATNIYKEPSWVPLHLSKEEAIQSL